MSDSTPKPTIRPEWLAAYADGELGDAAQRRVDAWLAEHPEAFADLQDQESLGRANDEYWKLAAPPLPTEVQWDRTLSRIAAALPTAASPARLPYRYLAPAAALVGLAAALVVAVVVFDRSRPGAQHPSAAAPPDGEHRLTSDKDEEELVYRVATHDEVELIQLPEAAAKLVVVGKHPMADVDLVLALATDVQVLNYGPDDQGNLPDLPDELGQDPSILWAPTVKP